MATDLARDACAQDLQGWFDLQVRQVDCTVQRTLLTSVAANVDVFVRWARQAVLLWPNCERTRSPGTKQKYHSYPEHLRRLAAEHRVRLDSRSNGPAIAAFLIAGGHRPMRRGSANGWSVHHLYSGKFPYPGRAHTAHAVKEPNHFTQSAGLVAVHPVADALADEFACFAWLLRGLAYERFGYDPDRVFGDEVDERGFAPGRGCSVPVP